MQIVLATVATLLIAAAPAQGQSPAGLAAAPPLTVTFTNAVTLDEAVSFLSRYAGVVVEISATVSEDLRRRAVSPSSPISMRNVTVEEALDTVTMLQGLSYAVVSDRMVFIFKKA